ncbi:MAG: hypothetical protein IJN32_09800, partial [Thermoguttaceae bacterium]|nr:hypothetical protein [Thermoguttaceae bacterium]
SRATLSADASAYYFNVAAASVGATTVETSRVARRSGVKIGVEVSVLTKISTRAALSGADVEKERRL